MRSVRGLDLLRFPDALFKQPYYSLILSLERNPCQQSYWYCLQNHNCKNSTVSSDLMQWDCFWTLAQLQSAARKAESREEVYDLQITLQSAEKKRSNLFSNDYSCPQSIESPAPSNWRTKKKSRGKKGENDMPQKYSYHNDGQRGIHSCVIHQSTAMYLFIRTFPNKCGDGRTKESL